MRDGIERKIKEVERGKTTKRRAKNTDLSIKECVRSQIEFPESLKVRESLNEEKKI